MASNTRSAALAELPLKAMTFEILLVVANQDLHGYAIVKQLEQRSGGSLRLEPANLYRTLRTMMNRGLIEETGRRPDPELDDERRRYFHITRFGREVAEAEAARLERLVEDARARRLLAGADRTRQGA